MNERVAAAPTLAARAGALARFWKRRADEYTPWIAVSGEACGSAPADPEVALSTWFPLFERARAGSRHVLPGLEAIRRIPWNYIRIKVEV